MRIYTFILFFIVYSVECRKVVPINKNANIDFINMESGGIVPPNKPRPAPTPAPLKPTVATPAVPVAPAAVTPAPAKPAPAPQPVKPSPTVQTNKQNPDTVKQTPTQITPKPVNPAPAARPITTPGPGSVQQLITFYDSQGKASPIRPYSYSQAVKQG